MDSRAAMKIKITKADRAFSLKIRDEHKWKCQLCLRNFSHKKKRRILHCSHFFSRRNKNIRHDKDNATAHCFSCHKFLTENPVLFFYYIVEAIGTEKLWELEKRFFAGIKDGHNKRLVRKIMGDDYG